MRVQAWRGILGQAVIALSDGSFQGRA